MTLNKEFSRTFQNVIVIKEQTLCVCGVCVCVCVCGVYEWVGGLVCLRERKREKLFFTLKKAKET